MACVCVMSDDGSTPVPLAERELPHVAPHSMFPMMDLPDALTTFVLTLRIIVLTPSLIIRRSSFLIATLYRTGCTGCCDASALMCLLCLAGILFAEMPRAGPNP